MIESTYAQIRASADRAGSAAELDTEVARIVDEIIDWPAFSSNTMGKTTWGTYSPQQKATFIAAYKRLIARKYAGLFKPQPEKAFDVEFRGEEEPDVSAVVVKTTVFSYDDGGKVGVDVDYHFRSQAGGGYLVGDIVTDTVSRALSYRRQFQALQNKRGFDALIARIIKNAERSAP